MGEASDTAPAIVPLADMPEAIPTLAVFFLAEWEPYYGPDGPGDAEADLTECLNREHLPIAFVARGADGTVIGTAALKEESVSSHPHLGPWLAALVVAPEHRGKGVASALAERIEQTARDLGFARIYTAMSHDELNVLHRPEWRPLDTAPTLRDPVTVFMLELAQGE